MNFLALFIIHNSSFNYGLFCFKGQDGIDEAVGFCDGFFVSDFGFGDGQAAGGGVCEGLSVSEGHVEVFNAGGFADDVFGFLVVAALVVGFVEQGKRLEVWVGGLHFFDEFEDGVEGPHVEGSGDEGDEVEVGHDECGALAAGVAAAGVDDDVLVAAAHFLDFGAHGRAGELDGGVAALSEGFFAKSGEVGGGALVVGVDEQDVAPAGGEQHGNGGGDGGFAAAALDASNGNDHKQLLVNSYWLLVAQALKNVLFMEKHNPVYFDRSA